MLNFIMKKCVLIYRDDLQACIFDPKKCPALCFRLTIFLFAQFFLVSFNLANLIYKNIQNKKNRVLFSCFSLSHYIISLVYKSLVSQGLRLLASGNLP